MPRLSAVVCRPKPTPLSAKASCQTHCRQLHMLAQHGARQAPPTPVTAAPRPGVRRPSLTKNPPSGGFRCAFWTVSDVLKQCIGAKRGLEFRIVSTPQRHSEENAPISAPSSNPFTRPQPTSSIQEEFIGVSKVMDRHLKDDHPLPFQRGQRLRRGASSSDRPTDVREGSGGSGSENPAALIAAPQPAMPGITLRAAQCVRPFIPGMQHLPGDAAPLRLVFRGFNDLVAHLHRRLAQLFHHLCVITRRDAHSAPDKKVVWQHIDGAVSGNNQGTTEALDLKGKASGIRQNGRDR